MRHSGRDNAFAVETQGDVRFRSRPSSVPDCRRLWSRYMARSLCDGQCCVGAVAATCVVGRSGKQLGKLSGSSATNACTADDYVSLSTLLQIRHTARLNLGDAANLGGDVD